ncbi:hypothetical protein D1007_24323 [Hordeum vulgare]|nr:hypothetical protein D1007_24323 [Hordeum vulgare]
MVQPRDFDAHYAKLEEIETSVKGFMSTQFEYNSYFRRELKEQNSFLAFMSREVDDMAKEFLVLNSPFASLEKLEAALLGSNAVITWLDHDLKPSTQDIVTELGMLADDVCMVKHFPEAFLVRFFHQHHYTDVVGHRDFPFRDTRLQLHPWRLEAHSKQVDLVHHVLLCLDGLPLHTWDEYAVAQAIGPGCSIDYIEMASNLKTDTEVLGVWTWTTSPINVPHVNSVTLRALAGASHFCSPRPGATGDHPHVHSR